MNVASKNIHLVLLVLLTLLSACAYLKYQPQIIAADGKGWDGVEYFHLYENYAGEKSAVAVQYPFCKRVGLPYLASQLSLSAEKSFLFINLASGVLCVLFAFFALRINFSEFTSVIAAIPLIFYLFSPIRITVFCPFIVDPPAMALYSVALFFTAKRGYFPAFLALLCSCFFRESGLYICFVFLLALAARKELKIAPFFAMLFILFVFGFILQRIAYGDCSGSQLKTALEMTYTKLTTFQGIVKVFSAFSLTVGFALAAKEINVRTDSAILYISCWFFILSILMGISGGTNPTRIFYTEYPLYVAALAYLISDVNKLKVIYFAFAGLIANSFVTKMPEPKSYLPNNDVDGLFSFTPDYAHLSIAVSILAYWVLIKFVGDKVDWNAISIRLGQLRKQKDLH